MGTQKSSSGTDTVVVEGRWVPLGKTERVGASPAQAAEMDSKRACFYKHFSLHSLCKWLLNITASGKEKRFMKGQYNILYLLILKWAYIWREAISVPCFLIPTTQKSNNALLTAVYWEDRFLLCLHLLFKLSYYIMELTTGRLLSPLAQCLVHSQVTYTCNLIFSISMRYSMPIIQGVNWHLN